MIFLFFLALILFGPKKLPEIGRQIGRFMNEFRRASNEFRSQIESEIHSLEAQSKPQILAPQRAKTGPAGDPALPPVQAPLGSLASRIFNPPSPGQLQAAETGVSDAKDKAATVENTSAGETAPDQSSAPPVHSEVIPSKVAPDA